jgi:hypothetical protein
VISSATQLVVAQAPFQKMFLGLAKEFAIFVSQTPLEFIKPVRLACSAKELRAWQIPRIPISLPNREYG